MVRHRQRLLGRKARARVALVSVVLMLAALGAIAGRAIQDELVPRLTFSTGTAYAAAYGTDAAAIEASVTARINADLPLLQELWGVSGGPTTGIRYVEAPRGIRVGDSLPVRVHATLPDGKPFVGALVEVSWEFGDAIYRDVTYTDSHGSVDVTRRVDWAARNKRCIVAVRAYGGDMQSMGYAIFVPN